MAPKQGKNVPQDPESATKSTAVSNAIPRQSTQVLRTEGDHLLQCCNKFAAHVIELLGHLPYLQRYRSNWHPLFNAHKGLKQGDSRLHADAL
jgi:hypothetical protein